MFKQITEGDTVVKVPAEEKISKELEVFYNPVMRFNRDMTVFVLSALKRKGMQVGLPLAGTGIRGVRMLKELKSSSLKSLHFNDYDKTATKLIKENLKLNKIDKDKRIEVHCEEANKFLLDSVGFDYIDIDPFGTPNPFLDNAAKRISRDGILAVTATDTSALSGTYENACKRKYWATPLRNELMHEVGLRILIRKVQLVGVQYEKSLVPFISYSRDHYMRVFFLCKKGKKECDSIVKQHDFLFYDNNMKAYQVGQHKEKSKEDKSGAYGPLWIGKLQDKALLKKVLKEIPEKYPAADEKFMQTMHDELEIPFFYDIDELASHYKVPQILKKPLVLERLKKKGFEASGTHFRGTGIKTNASLKDMLAVLKTA